MTGILHLTVKGSKQMRKVNIIRFLILKYKKQMKS